MTIMLGNGELVQCDQFVYLGEVISEALSCDQDVCGRLEDLSSTVLLEWVFPRLAS